MHKHSFATRSLSSLEQVTSGGHRWQPAACPACWAPLVGAAGRLRWHQIPACRRVALGLSLSCSAHMTEAVPVPSELVPASSIPTCNILLAESGCVCTVLILAEASKSYSNTNNKEQ